jgi:choline dehydrogenase
MTSKNSPDKLLEDTPKIFDYIVCGSGSSGSVVAARLAESGDAKVLVLEAGRSDQRENVIDPNRWPMNLGSELDWAFMTQPDPELDGRLVPFNMGKVLGGGSSINVGTWSRGHQADWNFFAAQSNDAAWSYPEVLKVYLEKIEAWSGNHDPLRGTRGKMLVNPVTDAHPFVEAVLEAAQCSGLRRFPNANGQMMEGTGGCSLIDDIVVNGRRESVYQRYLAPYTAKSNVTILTNALVHRVIFSKGRAVGVECVVNGRPENFLANEQVILSLGAVNTPRVLLQSGVGSSDQLRALSIPVTADLPAVGEYLHDHVAFGCVWGATDKELPKSMRSQCSGFWKTDSAQDSPNAYTYVIEGAFVTPENAVNRAIPEASWSLVVGARLNGRGGVRLTSHDVDSPLAIKSGYLSAEGDLETVTAVAEQAIELGNQAALAPYRTDQVAPESVSKAELQTFLRRGLTTFWHQSGTARMGVDPTTSVVNGRLKVHGLEGLTVADASVFPRVTVGNTMAPSIVVGEMAAKFLTTK